MQRSYDVLFASSNKNKYVEVKQILHEHGIKVGFFKFTPVEIQSDNLKRLHPTRHGRPQNSLNILSL